MKRILSALLVMIVLTGLLPMAVAAAENETFKFELSIDGSETKEAKQGEIITVVLRLKRTDVNENYTMYAMQDEIRYDSTFFELVEGSAVLSKGIETTDISMRDNYREFYMNYLSTSGGVTWEADTMVGSFQLRVIADSGVTKITNEDYLVSNQDGSGSFRCEANELTVILSTECTIRFESNGGTKVPDQTARYGEKIVKPEDPTREGFEFDGWYSDLDRTTLWNFDTDTVTGNLTLYAGWQETTVAPGVSGEDSNVWYLIGLALLILLFIVILLLPRKRVTFNTMGGSEIKSVRVLKNSKIKAPGPTRKYRQVFCGWYKDEACTIPWDFKNDKVVENIVLFAKWI